MLHHRTDLINEPSIGSISIHSHSISSDQTSLEEGSESEGRSLDNNNHQRIKPGLLGTPPRKQKQQRPVSLRSNSEPKIQFPSPSSNPKLRDDDDDDDDDDEEEVPLSKHLARSFSAPKLRRGVVSQQHHHQQQPQDKNHQPQSPGGSTHGGSLSVKSENRIWRQLAKQAVDRSPISMLELLDDDDDEEDEEEEEEKKEAKRDTQQDSIDGNGQTEELESRRSHLDDESEYTESSYEPSVKEEEKYTLKRRARRLVRPDKMAPNAHRHHHHPTGKAHPPRGAANGQEHGKPPLRSVRLPTTTTQPQENVVPNSSNNNNIGEKPTISPLPASPKDVRPERPLFGGEEGKHTTTNRRQFLTKSFSAFEPRWNAEAKTARWPGEWTKTTKTTTSSSTAAAFEPFDDSEHSAFHSFRKFHNESAASAIRRMQTMQHDNDGWPRQEQQPRRARARSFQMEREEENDEALMMMMMSDGSSSRHHRRSRSHSPLKTFMYTTPTTTNSRDTKSFERRYDDEDDDDDDDGTQNSWSSDEEDSSDSEEESSDSEDESDLDFSSVSDHRHKDTIPWKVSSMSLAKTKEEEDDDDDEKEEQRGGQTSLSFGHPAVAMTSFTPISSHDSKLSSTEESSSNNGGLQSIRESQNSASPLRTKEYSSDNGKEYAFQALDSSSKTSRWSVHRWMRGESSSHRSGSSSSSFQQQPVVRRLHGVGRRATDEQKRMSLHSFLVGGAAGTTGDDAHYSLAPSLGATDFSVLTDAFGDVKEGGGGAGVHNSSMLIQRPPRTTWKRLRSAKDLQSKLRVPSGRKRFIETSSTLLQHKFETKDSNVVRPENRSWRRVNAAGAVDGGSVDSPKSELAPTTQHTNFSDLTWDKQDIATSDANTFAAETISTKQLHLARMEKENNNKKDREGKEEEDDDKASCLVDPLDDNTSLPGRPSLLDSKKDDGSKPGSSKSVPAGLVLQRAGATQRSLLSGVLRKNDTNTSLMAPEKMMMLLEESNCGDRPMQRTLFHPRRKPRSLSMEELTDILAHVNRAVGSKVRWQVISDIVDGKETAPVEELEIASEDMSFVSGVTNRSFL